jgi:uncharacterized LabA/DUF88 family protein
MAKIPVAVFMDWQNVYEAAREAFDLRQEPPERGNFNPLRVAQYLAAGNKRGKDGKLVRLEIHRGLPDASFNSKGHGAADRQRQAWLALDPVVSVHLRPVKLYDNGDGTKREEEKGIDVALAVSALEHILLNKCEVAIIFSHDSDISPPVEAICRLKDAGVVSGAVETASWQSDLYYYRIPPAKTSWGTPWGVVNQTLKVELFDQVETPVDYRTATP